LSDPSPSTWYAMLTSSERVEYRVFGTSTARA
jgi:hypothetical protein